MKYTKKQLRQRLETFCKEHNIQDAVTRIGKGGRVFTIQSGFGHRSWGDQRWVNKLSVYVDKDQCVLVTSRGTLSKHEDALLDTIGDLI